MNGHLHIRPATQDDAVSLLETHIASIRDLCAKDYTPGQIDAWITPKTADLYRKTLQEGNAIFLAEEHERVIGFIDLELSQGEIRSFYLRKEAARRGIGTALLQRAEDHFRLRGISAVTLTSTLTSVRFYEARGFTNLGLTTHRLKSGVEIECVKMIKSLVSPSHDRFVVRDLGVMPYRDALAVQEETHERVRTGGPEAFLLVEHLPVITMGRRGERGGMPNLLASPAILSARGVEVIQTDRGGDITFHGPGQLVVYPIIRLQDHHLTVGGYVHLLERAVIAALKAFGIAATADPNAIGVWTDAGKICALGVRIRRGVSLHGIALNVTADLSFFDLIIPCGITAKAVTSIQRLLGESCPSMERVKSQVTRSLNDCLQLRTNAHECR